MPPFGTLLAALPESATLSRWMNRAFGSVCQLFR